MQREQSILYRTPNGKKIRIPSMLLPVFEIMLDNDPPFNGDEVGQEEAYGRLRYAQAYIKSKLQEP
jgi:hypothetical protein